MVTKQDCINGGYFRFLRAKYKSRDRSGEHLQVRASGKCQTWKSRPEDFRLPIKYGMYEHGEITPRNAADFMTEAEYQAQRFSKNPASGYSFKVVRKSATNEWITRFYKDGVHLKNADYFTTDKSDAQATGEAELRRMLSQRRSQVIQQNPGRRGTKRAMSQTQALRVVRREYGSKFARKASPRLRKRIASNFPMVSVRGKRNPMSRKDYVAIAKQMRAVREGYAPHWDANLFRAHTDACKAIADYMKQDNAHFDRERFLDACGVNIPRKNPIYASGAENVKGKTLIAVQAEYDSNWRTLAFFPNTPEGKALARSVGKRLHRKTPSRRLRATTVTM